MPQPSGAQDERVILEHYESQARQHGLSASSTMADEVTRAAEIDAVLACLAHLQANHKGGRLLEIGCGNGYLLQLIAERYPELELTAIDYSPDMVELARSRGIPRCDVQQGDVRSLGFPQHAVDIILSERCVINVLDAGEQAQAFAELDRVLAPGGHIILIEAFMDGADNLNRARGELGLPPNPVPHHNRWLEKDQFLAFLNGRFADVRRDDGATGLPPHNFLSSHYFVSRVFYPAVTRREVLYNTEFVRFFQFLPPLGDYSPIQLFFLRKLGVPAP